MRAAFVYDRGLFLTDKNSHWKKSASKKEGYA